MNMTHEVQFEVPGHTIIRKIGEGGMGAVYLAVDNLLQRQVAVKALKANVAQEDSSMLRFQSEAITLAKLRHPNITMLYNLVQVDAHPCMIMEYVEGETLDFLIKSRGRFGVKEVLEVAIPVLDALQHAHSKGVIHRDIKPSNLMLSTDGEVKIMDFGIARIAGGSRLTRVGQAVGTPQYMSPEQVTGEEGNHASDIYSFGIVLYELLTGVTPFDSDSEFEVMQAHTNRKPITPDVVNPDIPEELSKAILKALEKDTSKRFSSAAHFKQCLMHIEERLLQEAPQKKVFSIYEKFRSLSWLKKLKRFQLPVEVNRSHLAGATFLIGSFLVVLLVIFSTPKARKIDYNHHEKTAQREEKPLIEVEQDIDMEKLMRGTQRATSNPYQHKPTEPPQRIPSESTLRNPSKDPINNSPKEAEKNTSKEPAKNPPKDSRKEPAKDPVKDPAKDPTKDPAKTPAKDPAKDPAKSSAQDPAKDPANIPVQNPKAPVQEPPKTSSLGKQVVIGRGTHFDATINESYNYDTVQDKMKITLSVNEPLVRSGVVLVQQGAKAHAIIHKYPKKNEMVLEITEVESVTGKRLKTLDSSHKATSFKKGDKFRVNLDYNRLN